MQKSLRWITLFSAIWTCSGTAQQNEIALKNEFAGAFKVGVAINRDIVTFSNGRYDQIISQHFNTLTIENDMKAEIVNPQPGVYFFDAADKFVKYGNSRNMFLVGHTLIWHNQTPAWFFNDEKGQPNTAQQQLARMEAHIKLVASRYAGKVQAWDVVNEVIGDDGEYRQTAWFNRIGDGELMVKTAFTLAAKYAPNTELYYNDFNAWKPKKRDGIVRMVKSLQAAGIRIDGIGIQAHWGLNFPKNHYIEDAIDAYSALGLKVMITELDVDVLPFTKEGQVIGTGFFHPQFQEQEFEQFLDPYKNGLSDQVSKRLADRYIELFALFYKKRDKIDRVTLWGIDDNMSWKNYYPVPDRTNYPLLWNRKLEAKPFVKKIAEVPNQN